MPTSVPTVWRKSSKSQGAENCIEVALMDDRTEVRDSKFPMGPSLTFRSSSWVAFLAIVEHARRAQS